jgi:hypothetical protein
VQVTIFPRTAGSRTALGPSGWRMRAYTFARGPRTFPEIVVGDGARLRSALRSWGWEPHPARSEIEGLPRGNRPDVEDDHREHVVDE